jgi:hypothetical protein
LVGVTSGVTFLPSESKGDFTADRCSEHLIARTYPLNHSDCKGDGWHHRFGSESATDFFRDDTGRCKSHAKPADRLWSSDTEHARMGQLVHHLPVPALVASVAGAHDAARAL